MKSRFMASLVLIMLLPVLAAAQDVYLTTQAEVDAFTATEVTGYLALSTDAITDLTPLRCLTKVNNEFYVHGTAVATLQGLENLQSVGRLYLEYNDKLTTLDGLNPNLQVTSGSIRINRNSILRFIECFNKYAVFHNVEIYNNFALEAIVGFKSLQQCHSLILSGNPVLTDISGFSSLSLATLGMNVSNNGSLKNCCYLYRALSKRPLSTVQNNGGSCSKADILANGPCENPMIIALQFKDRNGLAVGDVLVRVTRPRKADAKTVSQNQFTNLWGLHPYNALYEGTRPHVGGTFHLDFTAPEGWHFVGPDSMEYALPDTIPYYSLTDNVFILERNDGSLTPPAPVDAICHDENKAPDALAFITGSPSFPTESWCNAVDGVTMGREGTATVWPDENGPAWAIFRFVDDGTYQFNRLFTITGNGEADERVNRQATRIEVLVSTSGYNPSDFTSIGMFNIKKTSLVWHKLGRDVKAKYVMLRILEPVWSNNDAKQIVEFGVSKDKTGHAVPASQFAELAAIPDETALVSVYPNPFNPVTTISYHLAEASPVNLCIYNLTGEIVATLVDQPQQPGSYNVNWDAGRLPTGFYFCLLQAGELRTSRQLVLVR